MDNINQQLRQWVDEQWSNLTLNDFLLNPEFHSSDDGAPGWQALPGDAGFRRYFRLTSEPPLLAVYAPPRSENIKAFIKIAKHLRKAGVLTPAVAACDLEKGFLLIEDLGSDLLLSKLDEHSADALYLDAMKTLLQIQLAAPDTQIYPEYDGEKLRAEMDLFVQWFIEKLLQVELHESEKAKIDAVFTLLEESALEQPQVIVHRDFHSRNLIHRPTGLPGVIDFQDAVIGPVTYDVVSLFRDCYIEWPADRVTQWMEQYHGYLQDTGVIDPVSIEIFKQWFDWMGLQRHIKVLGIFARLSIRDGKTAYLNDLPLVIKYTLSVAEQYPALFAFASWFKTDLLPIARTHIWYEER